MVVVVDSEAVLVLVLLVVSIVLARPVALLEVALEVRLGLGL